MLPIVAAQHGAVPPRRPAGRRRSARCSTCGLVLAQYLAASGCSHDPWLAADASALPSRSVAQYTVALNVFGFFAVALLSGSLADSLRSAGARLEQASTEIADLQALNQHVIDSLPSGLATTDPPQRILTFNRARRDDHRRAVRAGGRAGRSATCCSCRRPLIGVDRRAICAAAARAATSSATGRRRPRRHRDRPDARRTSRRRAAAPGLLFTFQDVTDDQEARARRARSSSGWRRSARWRPASRTRSAIRSRRCRDRSRSCARSCRSAAEQEQLMDIVLRESERLNTTIRSFLAYARPQRFADRALRRAPRAERHGAAAAQQRRGPRRTRRSTSTCRPTRAVVRGRRRADQADRLEPRDQRPARDAATAAGCA